MLKISLIVYNCADYGGVETVASNLAKKKKKKHEVSIISIIDDQRPNMIPINSKIDLVRLIPAGTRLRQQQLKIFNPLKKYLKNNSVDIVLAMGQYAGFLSSPVSLVSKAQFVFCDHGALINQWHDKKTTMMRYIASLLCKRTVVLTEKSLCDYIERFHIKPTRISYIYNWIEPSAFDSVHYDKTSHKLLSAGRLSKEKGFVQLVKAMALIVQKHPDWILEIYGDGEEEENLRREIVNLRLIKNVFLKGHTDRLREYYKNYAAYVMPSFREGLPLTLLEAKINMLPIVSFDVDTGPREIVRDGVDGLLAEPQNIEDLADKICLLIENDELRERFSASSKGNLSLFEKETILSKWEALFEEIKNE